MSRAQVGMCIIVGMPVELCGWERLTELSNVTGHDGTTITRHIRRRATRLLENIQAKLIRLNTVTDITHRAPEGDEEAPANVNPPPPLFSYLITRLSFTTASEFTRRGLDQTVENGCVRTLAQTLDRFLCPSRTDRR